MKKTALPVAFILLLSLVVLGGQAVKVAKAPPPTSSGIGIISPTNTTYRTNLLNLNVSMSSIVGANINFSITYTLDGKDPVAVPLEVHYRNMSFTALITGFTNLPELSEGSHVITVNLRTDIDYSGPTPLWDNNTVYFSIDDGAKAVQCDYSQFEGLPYDPPIVTLVSPSQNATYNVPNVPLNATVQIRGWIYGNIEQLRLLNYSLDGHDPTSLALTAPSMYGIHVPYNVYGNNMLTGLTDGNHNLIIYGETFIGGLTCYFNETVSFKIDTSFTPTPEIFPATLVFVPSVGIAIICIGLFVYFKKHKGKVE